MHQPFVSYRACRYVCRICRVCRARGAVYDRFIGAPHFEWRSLYSIDNSSPPVFARVITSTSISSMLFMAAEAQRTRTHATSQVNQMLTTVYRCYLFYIILLPHTQHLTGMPPVITFGCTGAATDLSLISKGTAFDRCIARCSCGSTRPTNRRSNRAYRRPNERRSRASRICLLRRRTRSVVVLTGDGRMRVRPSLVTRRYRSGRRWGGSATRRHRRRLPTTSMYRTKVLFSRRCES